MEKKFAERIRAAFASQHAPAAHTTPATPEAAP